MRKIILSLFITLGVPAILFSQIDTIQFDEILITDSKVKHVLQADISGSSIQIESPHDVGEIFKREAGIGIVKRGNYAMEPVIRGFKYEQLNVQINGGCTSTNACPNRMDPAISQISPEDIEKVEVVRGPYNLRYGPNLGGVINIVTHKPEKTENFQVKGKVSAGYQSNGSNMMGDGRLIMTNKWADLIISGGYKDFGNYVSGDGEEISSSFNRSAYSVKLGVEPHKNHRVQLNWQQGFAKDIKHAGLPMDALFDNSSILSLGYQISDLSPKIFSLKTKIYGSFVDHEMSNEGRKNYMMVHANTPVTASVYGGRLELGMKTGESNILYFGGDVKLTAKDGYRNRKIYKNPCNGETYDPPKEFTDLVWQDSRMNDIGLFAENKYNINKSLQWRLSARVDQVSYQVNDPAPDFQEFYNMEIVPDAQFNISASTALSYQINNSLELQWAAGRGVRSPELLEMYINHFTVGMDAFEYLGNPNLTPEVNYQTDLRIEKSGESYSVYAGVFYSYLQNYITAKVDTTIPRIFTPCMDPKYTKVFHNVDEAFMTGFETGLNLLFMDHFFFDIAASYTHAQNLTWNEPLAEIPPFMLNSSLGYDAEKLNVSLKSRTHSAQNRVSESFMETATPGFSVFDFYLSYSPLKWMEIQLSVVNILDQNYVEHLSRAYKNALPDEIPIDGFYYEPGRSVNAGLKISF